jgi:hypothetical protein
MPEHSLRRLFSRSFMKPIASDFFYLDERQGQQRFIAAGLVFRPAVKG